MHAQRSFLATLAIAATQVLAFDRITVPSTVQAGTDVQVTVTNDLSSSDSFDAGFTDYRVYLSASAPNVGQGPVCYLVNQTAIDVTSVTVNIPASVGPSGADVSPYAIVIMEYNSDPEKDGPSGFQYSNDFSLEGGTGVFTAYESDRNAVGDADSIPCTAYDCARQCDQKNYKGPVGDDGGVDDASYKAAYACIAQCPGVTYPPLEDADTLNAPGTATADSSSSSNSTSSTAGTSSTSSAHGSSGATKSSSSSTTSSSQAGKTSGVAAAGSEAGTLLVEKAMLVLLGVTSMAVLTWL